MSSSSSMFRYVLILWLIFYKLPVLFPQFSISVRLSLYLFVIEMIFHSTCSCFHTYFSNSINNCETHNWNCQPFEQWIEEMDIGQCNAKWTKKKEKTNRNTLLVIWTCIVPQFIIFFPSNAQLYWYSFFFVCRSIWISVVVGSAYVCCICSEHSESLYHLNLAGF